MDLFELQAELRHFAAERDWQPFHTPKNLSTALMVEAAELAEIFQWMTPEQSQVAHRDPVSRQRIGEEVADVLLYLLQLADHSAIDIARAIKDKLTRNAVKHPATRTVARISPKGAAIPGTHVLLDYENVQPSEDELRAAVPDVSKVWIFHGPHQRQIEERFSSFGTDLTAVPISKTGKNALDFHLSFYMGYIVSRRSASSIVVVANDKGYEPVLEHARAMGFAVRQLGFGQGSFTAPVKKASVPKPVVAAVAAKKVAAKKVAAKKVAAKKVPAKKVATNKVADTAPATKKVPAKKAAPAKPVAVKRANPPVVKKVAGTGAVSAAAKPVQPPASAISTSTTPVSAAVLKKITENLRKMGDKRPVKSASLRRALKSFLNAEVADDSIEVALGKLIAAGIISIGSKSEVSYPALASQRGTVPTAA